jgi:hypothetical protein
MSMLRRVVADVVSLLYPRECAACGDTLVEGEEFVTVKYIQRSEREGYIRLVSQNPHHADKEIELSRVRAIALVKASIRMNSMR